MAEKKAPHRAGDTLEVAAAGGERAGLRALRQKLAGIIDDPDTPPYAVANLSRQLAAIMFRLGELGEDAPAEPTDLELALAKRAERRESLAATRSTGAPPRGGRINSPGPKPRSTTTRRAV